MRMRSLALSVVVLCVAISALLSGQTGVTNGEWPHWGGDLGNTKYSPLDQINRDNVKNLRIAWRWKIRELRSAAAEQHGRHAADGGRRPLCHRRLPSERRRHRRGHWRDVVELSPRRRASAATGRPRSVSRGVEYWTDGKQARIILHHARLSARIARREDRAARSRVRQERRHRSLSGLRSAATSRTASSAPHRPQWSCEMSS